MLALVLAVFAADTYALISLAVFFQIFDLEVIGFLETEDVRLLVHDHHRRCRVTEFP